MKYGDEIITESAIVSQFLADQFPSHLLKASNEPGGALQRARINFFVDTYFTKVSNQLYPILNAEGEQKEKLATAFTDAIAKEIEPLLTDAAPFFGGASKLTLAEASFLLGPKNSLLIIVGPDWFLHPACPLIPKIRRPFASQRPH